VIKKYTLPLSIFIVFENLNPIIWTSESFGVNSYITYINKSWFFSLNLFFRGDVFFSNSSLVENSCVDNKKNKNLKKCYNIFLKKNLTLFYVYYFYSLGLKLILLTTYSNNKLSKLESLDSLFKSASWLEREVSEMFRVSYKNKIDSRRLLLDYSKQENPLLKDYPTEGFNDVFYDFFDDQVLYTNSTSVEL